MNLKEIREMIGLMNENDLTEFELEKDGLRIKLKKRQNNEFERIVEKIPADASYRQPHEPQLEPSAAQAHEKRVEIKSPMVGTFYRAPAPDASPFVEIGSVIEPGQVICIIEAMKLMNEIKAEIKGKLVDVLVDNGEPVEFGQAFFVIEPS